MGNGFFDESVKSPRPLNECQRGIIPHITCTSKHADMKNWMHKGKRYISKTEIIDDNWPKTMTEIGGETLATAVTAHLLIVESFEWLPQKLHNSRMVHRVIVFVPNNFNCDIKTKAYVHLGAMIGKVVQLLQQIYAN